MEYVLPPMNPELARVRRLRMQQRYVRAVRYVRFLWGIAVLLLVLLLAEVVLLLLYSPRFWVYRIEVTPGETLMAPELIRMAAVPPRTNYHSLLVSRVAQRIEQAEPRVHRAIVRKGAVGVLHLAVEERQAVCQLGRAQPPRYVDAAGVVFTRPTAPAALVPVVEGLPRILPAKAFGTHLGGDPRVRAVLSCLREMDTLFNEYGPLDVSRVVIAPNGRMSLVLRQGTRVLLGEPVEFKEKMYVVRGLIIDASGRGYSLQQIDYLDASAQHRSAGLGGEYRLRNGEEGPS